jgi:transposase-like protein
VKINGEPYYLWRALDHEGEVLEFFVSKMRDKAAALKFLNKAVKRYGGARLPWPISVPLQPIRRPVCRSCTWQ